MFAERRGVTGVFTVRSAVVSAVGAVGIEIPAVDFEVRMSWRLPQQRVHAVPGTFPSKVGRR